MSPLDRWLSRVSEASRPGYRNILLRFSRQVGLSPDELIVKQKNGVGDGRYELLDLLEDYVNALKGTRSTKHFVYAVIRSFFLHNRCELPRIRSAFKILSLR